MCSHVHDDTTREGLEGAQREARGGLEGLRRGQRGANICIYVRTYAHTHIYAHTATHPHGR
jgi:hypothetical protein